MWAISAARTAWSIMTPRPDPLEAHPIDARSWTGSSRERPTAARWTVAREMWANAEGDARPEISRDLALDIALAVMADFQADPLGELANIRLPALGAGHDSNRVVAEAGLGLHPPGHALQALCAIGLATALANADGNFPPPLVLKRPTFASATMRAAHEACRGRRAACKIGFLREFLRAHSGDWIADALDRVPKA